MIFIKIVAFDKTTDINKIYYWFKQQQRIFMYIHIIKILNYQLSQFYLFSSKLKRIKRDNEQEEEA